ncbi:MAG: hypothetical protein Q9167_000651 [Letrouitia subvulpina]
MDRYRPVYDGRQMALRGSPPPPPPPEIPPLPHGTAFQAFQLPKVPSSDFSFRNNGFAPPYPFHGDHYRPNQSANAERHRSAEDQRGRPRPKPRNHGPGRHLNQRARGSRVATASRPLLSTNRSNSPTQLFGLVDARKPVNRFMPADDVSDSEEEPMEESESDQKSDNDGNAPGGVKITEQSRDILAREEGEALEPPNKRQATTSVGESAKNGASSAPRWSNPDPYTVLPPVDEAQRKRKDVVKMIRKARIVTKKDPLTESQAVADDDFVSFGFESDNVASSSTHGETSDSFGISGAPIRLRAFGHPKHFHEADAELAPGTSATLSAERLGPPPSFANNPPRGKENVPFYPDQSDALGGRKRTHDDQIKLNQFAPKNRMSNGYRRREWNPSDNMDPTPWVVDDSAFTENPGFRPQNSERTVREELLYRLEEAVEQLIPGCNIHCFGSFAAGLYLPNADMDVVVISSTFRATGQRTACQSMNQMVKFGSFLERCGLAERDSIDVIAHAKVPLVKFVDRLTSIRVDISFENQTGLIANQTFYAWKRQYPAMPVLVMLIKQFLMMRGLNEVVNGGLGGFSVTCLVTSLLQNMPRVQKGDIKPEETLGEVLLEFLDLYGNQFDLARTAIVMDPPGYVDKARDEILKAMRSSTSRSLLDWCVGGNYEPFVSQRQRLRALYKERWGSPRSDSAGLPDETDHLRMVSRSDFVQMRTSSPDERTARFYVNPVSPGVIILPQLRRKRLKKNSKKKAKPDQPSSNQSKTANSNKPKKSKKKPKTGKENIPSGHQPSKVQKRSSKNH